MRAIRPLRDFRRGTPLPDGPPEFGRIEGAADRVLVVATGPSMRGIEIKRGDLPGVHIIAVKQAIHAAHAHTWVTVDPNVRSRFLMGKQAKGTEYIAAVPDDYGTPQARLSAHRVPLSPNVTYVHRIVGDGPLHSMFGLSEDRGALHTGNSAWGALGVAYLLGARKIGFLGLDGSQAPHGVGEGAPRGSLAHLPALFASSLPQLSARGTEVLNGSPQSKIACFYRVTKESVLRWVSE